MRIYRVALKKIVAILMMSPKLATFSLPKIKIFQKAGCDVVISVHEVTNKVLSSDSNHTVDVAMWPGFGNSSISTREVIATSIF